MARVNRGRMVTINQWVFRKLQLSKYVFSGLVDIKDGKFGFSKEAIILEERLKNAFDAKISDELKIKLEAYTQEILEYLDMGEDFNNAVKKLSYVIPMEELCETLLNTRLSSERAKVHIDYTLNTMKDKEYVTRVRGMCISGPIFLEEMDGEEESAATILPFMCLNYSNIKSREIDFGKRTIGHEFTHYLLNIFKHYEIIKLYNSNKISEDFKKEMTRIKKFYDRFDELCAYFYGSYVFKGRETSISSRRAYSRAVENLKLNGSYDIKLIRRKGIIHGDLILRFKKDIFNKGKVKHVKK